MRTFIRAEQLLDGTGAPALASPVVTVEDGRIASVATGPGPESPGPDDRVLDFPGCTILPGLIDTHVHLNLPGDGTTLEEAMREEPGVLLATSAFQAARALAAGITTVRDLGGLGRTTIDLRRALSLGHGEGARVVACGQPITITGGHTWYFGGEADGVEGVRRKVREMIRLGADFIKVMASGGGTLNTQSWNPAFSPAELAALVDEAHRNDRKITMHCLCAASIDAAIAAGADQIEHAGFIADRHGTQRFEPATAERLARSGTPVTATLAVGGAVLRAMRGKPDRTAAENALLARWERMHAENLDHAGRLRGLGVVYVAGTDAGWRHTRADDLPLELELMHEAGMPAAEAIEAATGRAARVIGLAEETGTLKPGLTADILVVGGDPVRDLRALRDVRMVMQAGRRLGDRG